MANEEINKIQGGDATSPNQKNIDNIYLWKGSDEEIENHTKKKMKELEIN